MDDLLRQCDSWEFEFSTNGNGLRFAACAGHLVRYAYASDTWYIYTGSRWVADTGERLQKLELAVLAALCDDATRLERLAHATPGAEGRRLEAKAAAYRKFLSARLSNPLALQQMSEAARPLWANGASSEANGDTPIAVTPSAFDRHPHLLNFRNCVVDLRSGTCLPHDPALLLHQQVPHCYVPGAVAPRWLRFIDEIADGKADRVEALKMCAGYVASGDYRMRKAVLLYGPQGANGKTVWMNTILSALGFPQHGERASGYYATGIPITTLQDRRGRSEIEVGVVRMHGKRMVVAVEPSDERSTHGRRFDSAVLKTLTGNDYGSLQARVPHSQELVTVEPGAKLVVLTNHQPQFTGDDSAWDRFYVIPFDVAFKGREERDLLPRLLAELPGVLTWIVEGARRFFAEGALPVLADVEVTNAAGKLLADPLSQWIDACCELDPSAKTPARALFESYRWWLRDRYVDQPRGQQLAAHTNEVSFAAQLDRVARGMELGRTKHRTSAGIVRLGIRLRIAEDGVDYGSADADAAVNAAASVAGPAPSTLLPPRSMPPGKSPTRRRSGRGRTPV